MGRYFRFFFLFIAGAIQMLAQTGCEDDDDTFSSDGSLHLTYSTDTLEFEPMLASQMSSTRQIKIYNRSKKNLKIEKIWIESTRNDFQINADGQTGDVIEDIELKKDDSLYVFVRAKIDQLDTDKPTVLTDSLVVEYNGNRDRVILTAIGQNATLLRNFTIERDTTWTNTKPFWIYDTLKIARTAKLTIEQGTQLLFHHGALMIVEGSLDIRGTASAPVLLGGDRYDYMLANIPYNRLYGQWEGIRFGNGSTSAIIEGTIFRGSSYGIVVDTTANATQNFELTIGNSLLETSTNGILSAKKTNLTAYNSIFANGGNSNVDIEGGQCKFIQCTIANYSTNRTSGNAALRIRNIDGEKIKTTELTNCIVYGSAQNELDIAEEAIEKAQISNSLLRQQTPADTSHYLQCKWNEDPGFTLIPNYLYYSYKIDSTSAARNMGSMDVMGKYPETQTDLDGNPRLLYSENPDAGAYAWTPSKQ